MDTHEGIFFPHMRAVTADHSPITCPADAHLSGQTVYSTVVGTDIAVSETGIGLLYAVLDNTRFDEI
ncbi:MAG: hypothetical protein MUO62_17385 [Anaerolineales bacterium]|nr:hypothetical protein [Anaerolineales bacterium]